MNENMMNRSYEVQVEGDSLGRYTAKTFGWMFAGLLVTFIVAVGFAMTGTIFYIYSFRYWPLALLVWPGAYSSCMPPLTALYSAHIYLHSAWRFCGWYSASQPCSLESWH